MEDDVLNKPRKCPIKLPDKSTFKHLPIKNGASNQRSRRHRKGLLEGEFSKRLSKSIFDIDLD